MRRNNNFLDFGNGLSDFFSELLTDCDRFTNSFPQTSIQSDNEKSIVTVEVPGINPDDIQVSITDDTLTIKHQKEGKETNNFERTITLPARYDTENLNAECKHGLLTITIPYSKINYKEIKIKVE